LLPASQRVSKDFSEERKEILLREAEEEGQDGHADRKR
jgi:hypothetical protein